MAIVQYKSQRHLHRPAHGRVSWGALAGAFLAPFLYGLYWKKTTKAACWVSFLFCTMLMWPEPGLQLHRGSCLPHAAPVPHQLPAPSAMVAGLVIVPVVSASLPRKPDKQLVDEAFACYDKKTPVSQKNALSD